MKSGFQRVAETLTRLSLVILLLCITLTFAIIQGDFLLWFVFFSLLPFAIYSIIVSFTPISNLTVERKIQEGKLEAGDEMTMTVVLKRHSFMPVLFFAIQEVEPHGIFEQVDERLLRKVIPIGFKRKVTWKYPIKSLPRGRHELTGIQVGAADVLGWVRKTKYVEAKKNLVVYPKIETMYFNKAMSNEQGQYGYTSRKKLQHSTMVASVREYAPGDRMTWLHWPSFAKTGTLYTKEFEYQQSEDLCVIFDNLQGQDYEGHVSLAASIMTAALNQKEAVSFLGAGKHRFAVDEFQAARDLEKVMYYLATVEPESFHVNKYADDELLTSAHSLVLITSKLTYEWIELLDKQAKKGNQPVVYVVRPKNVKVFSEDIEIEKYAQSHHIKIIYTERTKFASLSEGGIK